MDLISNVRTYGLFESIVASGYPMKTEPLNSEEFVNACKDICIDDNSKDKKRAISLAQTNIGEGHDNYLNGMVVQFGLNLSEPITLEFNSVYGNEEFLNKFDKWGFNY